MGCARLTAVNAIDPKIQAHYRLIASVKNTVGEHCHDFFELFLIVKGSVIHCINGKRELLHENTLVFIRDRDIHYYEQTEEGDCQFINLSFYRETIQSIFEFLGEGFPKDHLLHPEMPPSVVLTKTEKEYIQYRFENLNTNIDANQNLLRAELRALLVELFSRYIMKSQNLHPKERPEWLNHLCTVMKEKENFIEGMPALLRISQKTHSYLCRTFKKCLNTTPVEYINSLRMSYAENLLLHTDMDILDICLEIGFENMGYFYEVFKRYFNMTPYKLRKQNLRSCLYPGSEI